MGFQPHGDELELKRGLANSSPEQTKIQEDHQLEAWVQQYLEKVPDGSFGH